MVICHVESHPGELDSWYWEENVKPILTPLMVKEYCSAFNLQPKNVTSCSQPRSTIEKKSQISHMEQTHSKHPED